MSSDIFYMWNLEYDTNEPTYETETQSGTEKSDGRLLGLGEVGREMEPEIGVSRCGLSCTEWISRNILLYSRQNYIQYYTINYKEK